MMSSEHEIQKARKMSGGINDAKGDHTFEGTIAFLGFDETADFFALPGIH